MKLKTYLYCTLLGSLTAMTVLHGVAQTPDALFEPTWESLKRHEVPEWYHDAKLGIFIHWGLYSVPAWAPTTGELGAVAWARYSR